MMVRVRRWIVVVMVMVVRMVVMLAVAVIVVFMIVVMAVLADHEFRCRHARAQHSVDAYVAPVEGQAAERAFQLVERQPGVHEGAQQHVPGNPGEAVEIQHATHSRPISFKLLYRTSPRMM